MTILFSYYCAAAGALDVSYFEQALAGICEFELAGVLCVLADIAQNTDRILEINSRQPIIHLLDLLRSGFLGVQNLNCFCREFGCLFYVWDFRRLLAAANRQQQNKTQ